MSLEYQTKREHTFPSIRVARDFLSTIFNYGVELGDIEQRGGMIIHADIEEETDHGLSHDLTLHDHAIRTRGSEVTVFSVPGRKK